MLSLHPWILANLILYSIYDVQYDMYLEIFLI